MDDEIRDLVEQLCDHVIDMANLERKMDAMLRVSDDDTRTAVAYLMEDLLNCHPRKDPATSTSLKRIEEFIGHRVKVADWHCKMDELEQEWDELRRDLNHLIDDTDLDNDDY